MCPVRCDKSRDLITVLPHLVTSCLVYKFNTFDTYLYNSIRILFVTDIYIRSKFIQRIISLITQCHCSLNITRFYFLDFQIQFKNGISQLIDSINII